MSREIDERVVDMQFNNHDFESKVQSTLTGLDKLNKGLDMTDSVKGFENLGAATSGINLNPLINGVQTVHEKFSALEVMAITALQNITNSAVNAGKELIHSLTIEPIKEGFSEYELKMGSVQTIMAGTGESLDVVMEKLNELNTYADKTIYSFADMTSNIGKFTNAGVNLEDSVAAIQGVANVAAISGANANEASRAMYNFAQALSAGYVKLIDWKSIENANMATVDFKTNLLEAAVAAGTVEKTADGMYKVLTKNAQGGVMETAISATRNFNDSLSYQWMTTEVLTETLGQYSTDIREMSASEIEAYEAKLKANGYTEEQIKEIEALGMKAADAAKDVKTFTQLIDTLKEAVGSGWAETWELVFGDFEEAKKLWTGVSDAIGGIIGQQAEARNALLSGGLSSGWKQLMKEGVKDTATFKEEVTQVAREHGIAVDEMIKDNGSFEESLKEGWLSADIMAESLQNIVDTTAGLSREQLAEMGITEDQAAAFSDLNARVKDGSLDLEEYAQKIGQMSGRENLIAAFKNGWDALLEVVSAVKKAFRDVFPPTTAEQLYSITETIRNLSERFKDAVSAITNLDGESSAFVSTFRGLFSVIDIVAQAISAVWDGIKQLITPMGDLAGSVLGVTGSFGDWLYSLDQTIKKQGIFKTAVQNIVNFLKAIPEKIRSVFQSITGITISDALDAIIEKFHSFGESVREFFRSLRADSNGAEEATKSIEDAVSPLGTLFDGLKNLFSGVAEFFKSLMPTFSGILSSIGSALGSIGTGLKEAFENANINDILELVKGGIFAALGVSVKGLIDNLSGLTEKKEGSGGGLKGILDPLRETLESYQNNLKADTLIKIAGAIGILVASVLILSTIDADALSQSVVALGALFGELVGAMALLNKGLGDTKGSKLTTMSISLDLVAAAILILTGAMKKIAALDPDKVMQGIIGIGALLGELVLFLKTADLDGMGATKGLALIMLATALKSMSNTVADIGSMDPGSLTQGLIALGVVLAELVAFLKFADLDSTGVGSGAGLLLIATSLKVIASAVEKIGAIDTGSLIQGLIGVAAVLAEIVLFTKAASSTGAGSMAAVGAGLILMSAGITVLAAALKILGSMSLEQMAIAIGGLGIALAELALAVNAMRGAMVGAAALALVSAALLPLAAAVKLLGTMSLGEVGVALLALAGTFLVIGATAVVLAPLGPIILAIAAAVALFGAGMLACATAANLFAVSLGTLSLVGSDGLSVLIDIIATFINLVPELILSIAEGLIKAIASFAESIPELVTAAVAIITALCEAVLECLPNIMEVIAAILDATIALLVEYIPKIVDAAIDIVIAILNGIADKEADVIDAAINMILSFVEGLAKGIKDNTDRMIKAFEDLGKAILDAFLAFFGIHSPSTVMADTGKNIVQGLINGVKNKIKDATDAILELGRKMLDGIKGFVGDFTAAAKDVVGGLCDGIRSRLNDAWNAAQNLGNSMLNGIKDLLGIHSPSKEMAKVGRWSAEGFAEGMIRNATMVAKAADELGNTAVNNLYRAFDDVGTNISETIDDTEIVFKPVLDLSSLERDRVRLNSVLNAKRSLGLAIDANLGMEAISVRNQNESFIRAINKLDRQMTILESSVSRLQRFADNDMGYSVGRAVKQALDGTGVFMSGKRVGQMVTDEQSNMIRRGG